MLLKSEVFDYTYSQGGKSIKTLQYMATTKNRIIKAIKNPAAVLVGRIGYENVKFIPDKTYLKIMYKYYMGRKLNLVKPESFNAKLQWLKLYDRKAIYTNMADKVKAREIVKVKIGEKYLVPLIGIWNTSEEIDFNSLPEQFVMKCNHNSGKGMCICQSKTDLDIEKTKADLKAGLEENYYYSAREWPYKNIKRKIICEKYLSVGNGELLNDYKVLCFNGKPKLIELHKGRFSSHQTEDFYDTDWNKTDISQYKSCGLPKSESTEEKPSCLNEMLELSGKLAEGIPHLRVDWYVLNGKLYFGEMTFYDGAGFDAFDRYEDDLMLGSWIHLPDHDTLKKH